MNAPDSSSPHRMDRRTAIKWMLTAAASVSVLDRAALGAETPAAAKAAVGYGTDPDLVKIYKPGDVWALTFTDTQRRTATALCDVIIPADSKSPAASTVGVPDFIDEWISAPYPGHDRDRTLVLDGLKWIDAESQKRFGNDFAELVAGQQRAICDDICYVPKAKPEFKTAAQFFNKFRDLTSGGFYTTPVGMKDIGYVGNVPIATFEGATPAALKHLGLA